MQPLQTLARRLVPVAPLLLCLVGCGRSGAPSARTAISEVYKGFQDAFARGDADAIARVYTDDAVWYVPNMPPVTGRAAIAVAWKQNVGSGGNRLRIDIGEVEERGDRANEIGRFTISAPDGGVIAAGKYIVVWARQANGEWKTYRGIFNWDIPPRSPEQRGDG